MARLVVGVVVILALLILLLVFLTRRRRDKELLKVSPLLLQKKGLDREALLQLDARQKEVAQLRQTLGSIAGLLEQALGDEIVTLWGPETRETVGRALEAAREYTKEK